MGEKLGVKLKGWYNRVTLRGACEPNSCGGMNSIHVDHQAKAVSVLIYLNEETFRRHRLPRWRLALFEEQKKS